MFGYQKTHRILTVASRDVYTYNYYNINDDGSILHVVYDDEKDDMPEEPGCVRMQMPLGGVHFQPLKGDPTKCTVTMYGEASLGGSIPAFV